MPNLVVDHDSETSAMQEWEILQKEGYKLYKGEQWSKAADCYSKAIDLNPTNASLYGWRALCQLMLLKFADAREDAETAIRFDPMEVVYYRALSWALKYLKLYREAAEACRAGLEINPCDEDLLSTLLEVQALNADDEHSNKQNHVNRGYTSHDGDDGLLENGFFDFKNRDEKLVHKITIAAQSSTFSDFKMRANRGSVTARRYLSAKELLQEAVLSSLDGKDSSTVLGKFRAAIKLWTAVPLSSHELMKIHEMAKEALQKDPEDADALFVLTFTEFGRRGGDCKGLLPMAKRCVTSQPSVPEFQERLGHMYAHAEDYKEALKCFERALELEWSPLVLFHKGRALFHGKLEAKQTLEQYIKAGEKDDPYMLWACYAVALLCLKNGDKEKAFEYFKKGQEAERQCIKLPFSNGIEQEALQYKASVQAIMSLIAATGLSLVAPTSGVSPVHDVRNDGLKCGACKTSTKTLSVCVGCKKIQYCGRDCQKKHWPTHKKSCTKKHGQDDNVEAKCGAGTKSGLPLVAPTSDGSTVRDERDDVLKCGECKRSSKTLSLCGGCEKIRYCGPECQKKHWPTHKKSCTKKHGQDDEAKCGACTKSGKTLNVCGGCEKVRYCGVECQRKHWPTHKYSCVKK